MHVVITSRALPFHRIGGMEVITWDFATELVQKGMRVSCVTTSINGYPSTFSRAGVDVIALSGAESGIYSKQWWRLSKQYVEENYICDCDVLFSVSASGFSVISLKSRMKNTVFIFQAHGTSVSEIISKLRLHTFKSIISIVKNIKWLFVDISKLKKFDCIVASGDRVYKDFNNPFYSFFLKNKVLTSIPNGINLKLFKPSIERKNNIRAKLNIGSDEFVVLIASRLHKQKGISEAVLAFFKYNLLDKSSRLIIIGDGPESGNILELTKQHRDNNLIYLIGSLTIEELSKYINASDVYLFTTLHEEGLPLLPLEALASGVPVVASNHLKELNEASDAVIAVNPRNIDSIVHGLQISNKYKLNQKCLLPSRYHMDVCVNEYLTLFKDILKVKNIPTV